MPSHIRKQVRDAVKTALTGLATTGPNVWSGRVAPLTSSERPGLMIFLNIEDGASDAMGTMQRNGRLRIEGLAEGNDELIDTLDQIALEVETAIPAAPGLLALLMAEPDPPNTTIVVDDPTAGASRRTGSVIVEFPIQYRTTLGDPSSKA